MKQPQLIDVKPYRTLQLKYDCGCAEIASIDLSTGLLHRTFEAFSPAGGHNASHYTPEATAAVADLFEKEFAHND